MQRRGYYDYNDMIIVVNGQLEQNEELRSEVQENYLYVLIDEFQDTNAAQFRLAHLVSDHPAHLGRPNLMVVGDDDQTIYKFNGAELSNMLSFRRSYPSARLIVLAQNYRSSQDILNHSQKIIEQAQDRLVYRDRSIKKQLRANIKARKYAQLQQITYPTRNHQLALTAKTVKQHYRSKTGSVAVLARNHESLRLLAAELLAQHVPVRYEQHNNVLENEAVIELYKLASVVDAIAGGNIEIVNNQLSLILRHPMWKIKNSVLWEMALANYHRPAWLDAMLSSKNKKIGAMAEWFMELARQAAFQPLPVMIEYLLGLRPLNRFSSPLQDYFWRNKEAVNGSIGTLSAINIVLGLVHEFSLNRQANLNDFVRFLQLNIQNNEVIADESWFVSDSNAVQLLTVHKAKGLEFDTVFVIDAVDDKWRPRAGGRKAPANLPLQPYGDDFDDYARLMYVAITRAKQTFIATNYQFDDYGKEVLATSLLHDILPLKTDTTNSLLSTSVLETALKWPRLAPKSEKALLRARLDGYNLSASGLLDFLNVAETGPTYFLEKHILRLPEARATSMSFGRAMHVALERAQILLNNSKWSIASVLKVYRQALENEFLPSSDFERYLQHGEKVLRRLFNRLNYNLPRGSLPEQQIKEARLGDSMLTGILDRIDRPNNDELSIVDYKTGRPLTNLYTKNKAQAIKAWKHRTQMLFYTLLANSSDRFNASVANCQLVYIESETKKGLVLQYQPTLDELTRTSTLIQCVWKHLINLKFPEVSKYPMNISGIMAFEEDLIKEKI
jgi:DNA helicase-2/ATP-dependent DNA helicase PcrA